MNLVKNITLIIFLHLHRYQLVSPKLKLLCAESLSRNISVENVIEIIRTSEVFSLEELKTCAIEFIQNNFDEVSGTCAWNTFCQTDQKLRNEIFATICKKRKL